MFSIEEVVTSSRTDEKGRLKLVSAIDMMQDCSQLWLSSEPRLERYFQENNVTQLLASRQVDILRMPDYGEKLTTTTSVFECKGVQGFRNTVIYDEGNRPCLVSWSTGAFVNLQTNRLAKLPAEITDGMVYNPKIEMEYLERRIIIPNSDPLEFPPVEVAKNDIDMNGHMNNAQYLRIAFELLPFGFEIHRLRAEYKIPSRYKEILHPCATIADNGNVYVQLLSEERKVHAVIEFIPVTPH